LQVSRNRLLLPGGSRDFCQWRVIDQRKKKRKEEGKKNFQPNEVKKPRTLISAAARNEGKRG